MKLVSTCRCVPALNRELAGSLEGTFVPVLKANLGFVQRPSQGFRILPFSSLPTACIFQELNFIKLEYNSLKEQNDGYALETARTRRGSSDSSRSRYCAVSPRRPAADGRA